MTEKMAEIEERALARLMVPDALMPGQYYEGVRRDDPATGAIKRLMSHAFNHQHELFVARQCDSHAEKRLIRFGSYFDLAGLTIDLDRPPITIVVDNFHSRRCTSLQKANEGVPIEGWTIGQMEDDTAPLSGCPCAGAQLSEFRGRHVERRSHSMVKLSNAFEPREGSDLCDR